MKGRSPGVAIRSSIATAIVYAAYLTLPYPGLHSVAASRVKSWHKDLKALRNQLPALHANLFFKTSQAEFNNAINELDAAVASLQDHEIIVGMTRIVAMMGDGHTRLDWETTGTDFRLYPLQLYWFSDGLYVTATTSDYQAALGARLVRIGDTGIDQAYAAVSALISHENEEWPLEQSPHYLVVPEILNALKILPDMEKGHFVFEASDGSEFAFDLAPVARDATLTFLQIPDPKAVSIPLYLRSPDQFYWFDYLSDSRTLYIKYNVCEEMASLSASQFADQIGSFAASHTVDRFILDVRNNGGGSTAVLGRLMAGLQNRTDLNQPGRFFVIIGRGTFSSAMDNAITLKMQFSPILVGEPSGGKPNGYGEVASFNLPRSGLLVRYSTKFFMTVPGDPPSLDPDVNVRISSADFKSGRDPVLDACLTHQQQASR